MTQAQRQKWEKTLDRKLSPSNQAAALSRRQHMTVSVTNPLMETGLGNLGATMPGAPGSILENTMGPLMTNQHQAAPLDLER